MEAWQNFVVVLTPSGTTVVLTMLWQDNSTLVTRSSNCQILHKSCQ